MTLKDFNFSIIQHNDSLQSFAISLTRNKNDAGDLVQDTFVKAIQYRDKFETSTNFKAWLFTIMKNTFINNYRRNVLNRQYLESRKIFLSSNEKGFNQCEDRINSREIIRYIEKLEDSYKIPFTRHYTGYKYHEIASEMKLPIGTIKSRIYIARKILMDQLKQHQN